MKKVFLTIIPSILFFILCSATAFYLYSCQKLLPQGSTIPPATEVMGTFLLDFDLLQTPLTPIPEEYTTTGSSCFQNSIFYSTGLNNCSGAQYPLCAGAANTPVFNSSTSSIHEDEVALRVVVSAANPAMVLTTYYSSSDIVTVGTTQYITVSAPTTQTSSISVTLFDKCCEDGRLRWSNSQLTDQMIVSSLPTPAGATTPLRTKHINLFPAGRSNNCDIE